MFVYYLILSAAAFILGAIPFGLVISRIHSGRDIRSEGSGNIGATNVARTMGMKLGVLTLALDLSKGLIAVLVAQAFFSQDAAAGLAGFAAFLGHIYSPFLGFKGGKGVATALGAMLGLVPLAILPALIVFIAVTAIWGFVSAGSLAGALTAPAAAFLLRYPAIYCLMALAMAVIIIIRHRENIGRLMRGEENRWRKSGS